MAKEEISEEDQPMKQIVSLINQILKRDEGWKEYYTGEMNAIIQDVSRNFAYDMTAYFTSTGISNHFFNDKLYKQTQTVRNNI